MTDIKSAAAPAIDVSSKTWRELMEWNGTSIEALRTRLEHEGLDQRDADVLRGRLIEKRALKALGEPKPEIIVGA